MGGRFLLIRAKEAREQRATEAQEGFDELSRLLFVGTDQRKGFARYQVTTNQKNSQHAVCKLVCESAVKAFGHEIGRQSRTGTRGERYDKRP